MAGTTAWVRQALQELGPNAPDAAVKAYIREKAPSVPQSQIGLALRRLRGKVEPAGEKASPPQAEDAEPS
jgi:hypothetical protein